MEVIRKVGQPIAGERVLQVVPPMLPYLPPEDAGARARARYFTGRALTHLALNAEQRSRMTGLAALAQAVAPGVIAGLEVMFERGASAAEDALTLLPGRALAPSGEDIELAYSIRVAVEDIPIDPDGLRLGDADLELARLAESGKDITLAVLRGRAALDRAPHAMVLTAAPATVLIDSTGRLDTPCPNATGEGA
ncbi:MAG TPA: hypothetical protein VLC55_05490, partial [Burkholderiales bacterium]|nr:hypothetical protein [Burkholderiales bacterium]